MKQFIFTIILVTSISCAMAQFSVGMHVGGTNKNMVTGVNTYYQFKNRFTAGFNLTAHADKINPAFIQSRFGYLLGEQGKGVSIQPYLGYSYSIQNFEQKEYGGHLTGGMLLRYRISPIVALYADLNFPAPKYTMFTIGISGIIPRSCY